MSIDQPPQNKMMTAPPVKKGFHFASDGIHAAAYIEAHTIEEAENTYHRIKLKLSDRPTLIVGASLDSAPEQSTPPEQTEEPTSS